MTQVSELTKNISYKQFVTELSKEECNNVYADILNIPAKARTFNQAFIASKYKPVQITEVEALFSIPVTTRDEKDEEFTQSAVDMMDSLLFNIKNGTENCDTTNISELTSSLLTPGINKIKSLNQ